MNFESWRDFSLEGEHDVEDAHDRYEKRWMIKENERKAKVRGGLSLVRHASTWADSRNIRFTF